MWYVAEVYFILFCMNVQLSQHHSSKAWFCSHWMVLTLLSSGRIFLKSSLLRYNFLRVTFALFKYTVPWILTDKYNLVATVVTKVWNSFLLPLCVVKLSPNPQPPETTGFLSVHVGLLFPAYHVYGPCSAYLCEPGFCHIWQSSMLCKYQQLVPFDWQVV